LGSYWFRLKAETRVAYRGSLVGLVKTSGQKLNAEDNTSALLDEATHIINNFEDYLAEEEVYAMAA
jgi:hypothetical protein